MERPIIKDMEELEQLCAPLVSYLRKNCDPYIEIHISMDDIKVTSVECGIPVKEEKENDVQDSRKSLSEMKRFFESGIENSKKVIADRERLMAALEMAIKVI